MAKSLPELYPIVWKAELASDDLSYLAKETATQNFTGMA